MKLFRALPFVIAFSVAVGCSKSTPKSEPKAPAATAVTAEAPKPDTAAADAPKPDADGWYTIFNGKDLTGWKNISDDNPSTFQVADGELVVHGPTCHLYYEGPVNNANFTNFELKADVITKPGSNSGMYFHTKWQAGEFPHQGLEVQVNNSHADPIRTGSIYKAANIMNDSPAKDDEWFTQDITVEGHHIVVKVNDKVVNDHTEPEHPEREPGWENNVIGSGTFAIQGHDPNSEVHFKNIKVKPLP